jgi:branched-chain amino acid transport system ATP-binding protein
MSTAALEVRNLSCGYGSGLVLHEVDLTAERGRLTLVVGRNGAGKTTLLRGISGLLRPRTGTVLLDGADLRRASPRARALRGIAHVQEGRRVFRRQSVAVNLELAFANGRTPADQQQPTLEQIFAYFPILKERWHVPASTLSGGQQQMLAIGQALAARPEVLLMDEPSLGLAPGVVADVFEVIRQLRQAGTTLVLVEQMVEQALPMADHVVVLRNGRVETSGGPGDPGLRSAIEGAYLGDGPVPAAGRPARR